MERLCQYRDEKEAFHAEQARQKGTLFKYPYHIFNFIATNDPSLHSDFLLDCHCFWLLSGTFSSSYLVSEIVFVIVSKTQEHLIITKLNLSNRTHCKLY